MTHIAVDIVEIRATQASRLHLYHKITSLKKHCTSAYLVLTLWTLWDMVLVLNIIIHTYTKDR